MVDEVCNISNKINLLVIQKNINIFTKKTLYPSFISKESWRCPSQTFFETSVFYHIFTTFNSEWLLSKSAKEIFLHKTPYTLSLFVFSITEDFKTIHFFPHFYLFSQWMKCAIFKINTDLLKIDRHINNITQETS